MECIFEKEQKVRGKASNYFSSPIVNDTFVSSDGYYLFLEIARSSIERGAIVYYYVTRIRYSGEGGGGG